MAAADYAVPAQAKHVFEKGILAHPRIRMHLPAGADAAAKRVTFEGSAAPSLPINWRLAESIAALKAYEATVLNVLLQHKYGIAPARVEINTDHAQLFIMSTMLWWLDPDGHKVGASALGADPAARAEVAKYFPDWDKHRAYGSNYRTAVTNIYRTKDDRFFHMHGSMNPEPMLKALDLPLDAEYATVEAASGPIQEAVAQRTAEEMQTLTDANNQAGTICWTIDDYQKSEHGQLNADVGLFEIHERPNPAQAPCWWPATPRTAPARPLAGLKVVDLTRVIAAPTTTRGLADLGASVMRITAPHLPDLSALHPDLNHGKWNACLDLRQEADRQRLRDLVMEADVFVQGYRPGILDKYGFGEEDILNMCRARGRGIIYCAENCYGWHGPWSQRSGWQQISDANCGVSFEYGRAMGNDEPVTPIFPNSDYCTGAAGIVAVMTALLRRAEIGGSFAIRISLNHYSQWLVNSCGMYPADVWQELWQRNGSPVFRHYHPMQYTLPRTLQLVRQHSAQKLFRSEFFTQYRVKSLDKDMRIVAPVLQFPDGEVKPGFDVGTRTNGLDQPRWPQDLSVEVVE